MTTTSTTRAVVLLAVAFVLGLVVGGAAMRYTDGGGKRPGDRGDCAVRHPRVCKWAEELQLTKDQQEQLLAVYREGEVRMDSLQRTIRPDIEAIYRTIHPQVDSQRQELRARVRPLLTLEQREKYDSPLASWDRDRRQNPARQPGAPGTPGGPPRDRP